jgi:microcystin-dependent protein
MEPFIGQILLFAGDFAPRGWALCNGQLLSIAQNSALFSILGTTYGGDGVTMFAVPDLRGRVPMHWGDGPGLTSRTIGESSGSESVTLLQTQIPAHTHTVNASEIAADARNPANAILAQNASYTTSAPNTTMSAHSLAPAGGGQPHDNMQPFLAITFIIALEGIYPSRG